MTNKSAQQLDTHTNVTPEPARGPSVTGGSKPAAGPRMSPGRKESSRPIGPGTMTLHGPDQLQGDVEVRADVRIASPEGREEAPSREVQVSSKEEIADLLSALHRAGMPAQITGRSEDGTATVRIPVGEEVVRPQARLTVDGDLTLGRHAVCGLTLRVKGNLRLEPDAVLVGDVSVDGSVILEARSVVAGHLEVRGDAFLGPNALAGSLHTLGNFEMDEGATVLGELDVECAPRQASSEEDDDTAEEPVEHLPVPER